MLIQFSSIRWEQVVLFYAFISFFPCPTYKQLNLARQLLVMVQTNSMRKKAMVRVEVGFVMELFLIPCLEEPVLILPS